MHQQNPPLRNCRCQLTQVDLYNGRKTVDIVTTAAVLTAKGPHSCCHLPKIVEIIEHTLDIPYTLQWMSTQNCQFPTEPETPHNTRILGSTGVHILNGTSMGSLTSCRADSCDKQTDRQTDRHTDHRTSVTTG